MLAIEFGAERAHFHLRRLRAAMRVRRRRPLKTRARRDARTRIGARAVSESTVQRRDAVERAARRRTCVEYGYLRGERVSGSDGRAAALRPAGTDDRAIV